MLMADVISISLSILGFLLALQGLWLTCRALWPGRFARSLERVRKNPIKSFLVGLPITLGMILMTMIVAGLGGPGQFAAFVTVCLYVLYANIGVAGLVTHIGQRLPSPADLDRPWMATVRGGVALELAYLVPILGWIGLFIISMILGAGAVTLSFFRRGQPATSISTVDEMSELHPAEALP